jgi:hypothetical protein
VAVIAETKEAGKNVPFPAPFGTERVRAGDIHFYRADEHPDGYQRPPVTKQVNAIADDWDEAACGMIPVSLRGSGTYWALDGQQRTLAAIQRYGADHLMNCNVYVGLTIEQENRLFARFNAERTPLSVGLRYKAWYQGKHEEVVTMVRLLDEHHIAHSWSGKGQGEWFCAWSSLHTILKRTSEQHVDELLGLVKAAWPDGGVALEGQFLGGVSAFITRYEADPSWDWKKVTDRFQTLSPVALAQQAQGLRAATGGTNSVVRSLREVLLIQYNKKRTQGALGKKDE